MNTVPSSNKYMTERMTTIVKKPKVLNMDNWRVFRGFTDNWQKAIIFTDNWLLGVNWYCQLTKAPLVPTDKDENWEIWAFYWQKMFTDTDKF